MRAFLAYRTGSGTSMSDPIRPAVDFAAYGNPSMANWDIEHPDTNEVLGFIVVWTADVAPAEAITDLGDPTDRTSMRTTPISQSGAQAIAGMLGIPVARVQNMTGTQVIRFLNRKDPIMNAEWRDTIATLVDQTD